VSFESARLHCARAGPRLPCCCAAIGVCEDAIEAAGRVQSITRRRATMDDGTALAVAACLSGRDRLWAAGRGYACAVPRTPEALRCE
jgi:hypothetical protein